MSAYTSTSSAFARLMGQAMDLDDAELTPPKIAFNPDTYEVKGSLNSEQRRLYSLYKRTVAECARLKELMAPLEKEIAHAISSGVNTVESLRKLASGALSSDLVERYAALSEQLQPKLLEEQALRSLIDFEMQIAFGLNKAMGAKIFSDWSVAVPKEGVCPGCGARHAEFDLFSFLQGGEKGPAHH